MNKVCFKCGQTKDVNEFYRHPMMGDGRLGKCKECTKRDVRLNNRKNAAQGLTRKQPNGNRYPEYQGFYRRKNPEKYAAVVMLNNAVRDRQIIKASACEICGETKNIEAHHHDYQQKLSVWWLCASCHRQLHGLIVRVMSF